MNRGFVPVLWAALLASALCLSGCRGTAPQGAGETAALVATQTPTKAPTASKAAEPALSVSLNDPGGQPVAGAAVSLTDPLTLETVTALTSSDGTATLPTAASGSLLLTVSATGYADAGQAVDMGEQTSAALTLTPLTAYKPYVMAFATRSGDGTGRIYLAQSDDGAAWELITDEPVAQGLLPEIGIYFPSIYEALMVTMSPDPVFTDGELRVYYDDQFAYMGPSTGAWYHKTISQNPFGVIDKGAGTSVTAYGLFDYQVNAIEDGGTLYLLGKNAMGYGYNESGLTSDQLAIDNDALMGWASESDRSAGQAFECRQDRYLALLEGRRDMLEPDWFPVAGGGWAMVITGSDGLYLYGAAALTDPYEPWAGLSGGLLYSAGNLAGACVDYDPGTGLYSVYVSELNGMQIRMAQTDTLDAPLTGSDFSTVIDLSLLPEDQRDITFLGNPGICRNQADASAAVEARGPFDLSLEEYERYSLMVGTGASSWNAVMDSGVLSLGQSCGPDNPSFIAAVLPAGYFTGPMVSVDITLPDDPDAMGGLAYCWQDTVGTTGGYCFAAGPDGWKCIQVSDQYSPAGSFSGSLDADQITVVAQGDWDQPFTSGRLTVALWGGIHYFFRDGELVGQAAVTPPAVCETGPEQLMTGQCGIYIEALSDLQQRYAFTEYRLADLTGAYTGP